MGSFDGINSYERSESEHSCMGGRAYLLVQLVQLFDDMILYEVVRTSILNLSTRW